MSHIIKDENLIPKSSNLLNWRTMKLSDRPSNYGWAEEALNANGDVVYILYFDNEKNQIILKDIRHSTTYDIGSPAKAKGYMLAFKLNTLKSKK